MRPVAYDKLHQKLRITFSVMSVRHIANKTGCLWKMGVMCGMTSFAILFVLTTHVRTHTISQSLIMRHGWKLTSEAVAVASQATSAAEDCLPAK